MEDLEEDFSEKEYAVYAEYFLTGKTDELPLVLFPGNPLKKPVIVAFLFAFLACGWYAAAYFFSGKVKTADEMAALTRKNVLGFVNESAPRKCFIDRWLDGLESHSFPTSVSAAYVSAAAAKLGRAVVVYDENDADLQEIVREMSIPCLGLLGQNPNTLNRVQKDDQVVLLVKLGTTTKMQVQREAALCAQYGISLAGSILVK